MENVNSAGNTSIVNNYYASDKDSSAARPDYAGMGRNERIDAYVDFALSEDGPGAEIGAQAFEMAYGQDLAAATKDHINGLDIPQGQKDIINDAIDHQLDTNGLDTVAERSDMLAMAREFMQAMAQEDMDDAVGEAGNGAEAGAGAKGGGSGGNWLVDLAKAMSKVASNHLEKMIDASNKIGALGEGGEEGISGGAGDVTLNPDGSTTVNTADNPADKDTSVDKDNAALMTQLTAQMQAHTQLFKMVQEATTTTIKTAGEALNGSVRKQ